MQHTHDTICAIATAQGEGAISLIRVSGKESFSLVQKIFKGKNLQHQDANTIHFGKIIDPQGLIIDEVLISIFKSPKSYTGEDLLEISCHGSSYIQQKIIEQLLQQGVRMASKGEFTMRAFLNGKLNLSQAEAVADLIASENESQHNIAMQQMRGGYHNDLKILREKLIHFAALIELELDFAEEDVEFANRDHLQNLLKEIEFALCHLKESFHYGNAIKNGIYTVIAGRPNAGKSTLLNKLLNEERAIVSPIAGTTRDTIEEILVIEGIKYRFIDTAGIRTNTLDEIEKIGIRKTLESIEKASILMYVFDLSTATIDEIMQDISAYLKKGVELVLIGNKVDLLSREELVVWEEKLKTLHNKRISHHFIGISAKNSANIEDIKKVLATYLKKDNINQSIVSNIRHYDALDKGLLALQKAQQALTTGISSDFLAMDIRKTLYHIGEITGEVDVDKDILGTIFSKFCIGK